MSDGTNETRDTGTMESVGTNINLGVSGSL